MGKLKLRKYLQDNLYDLYQKGVRTEKENKDVHNSTPFIHSNRTYMTYKQQVNHFCDYMKDRGLNFKMPIDQLKNHVCNYLKSLEADNKSAWTVSTALCGIAKAMNLKTTDFNITIKKRHRNDVVRSRYETETDKHVSKAHNEAIITFCKCTGLRRHELEALKKSDISIKENGHIYVHVDQGKGGRKRNTLVIGTQKEVRAILKLIDDKEGHVFEKVPKNLDIHSYRSDYACRAYNLFLDKKTDGTGFIPPDDRYYCRGDKKGVIYHREVMKIVSHLLGHNRIDVISNSYLHRL